MIGDEAELREDRDYCGDYGCNRGQATEKCKRPAADALALAHADFICQTS